MTKWIASLTWPAVGSSDFSPRLLLANMDRPEDWSLAWFKLHIRRRGKHWPRAAWPSLQIRRRPAAAARGGGPRHQAVWQGRGCREEWRTYWCCCAVRRRVAPLPPPGHRSHPPPEIGRLGSHSSRFAAARPSPRPAVRGGAADANAEALRATAALGHSPVCCSGPLPQGIHAACGERRIADKESQRFAASRTEDAISTAVKHESTSGTYEEVCSQF